MRAVHFGAGNIGRGFIGQILFRSNYEICFVDVNETLVNLLQTRHEYTVSLADESHETMVVRNVTALSGNDMENVAEAIAQADLVTTAVGVNILKHIAPTISAGIALRITRKAPPLHVIACENAIKASSQLKEHIYTQLTDDLKAQAERFTAFPNAAVDRIVPVQHNDDPLHVTVEPFFEWIIDRSQMIGKFTPLRGVHYVDDLLPYIERKLFTVNTGHCCAAYLGYLSGQTTIQQALADPGICDQVTQVMEETGALLVAKHNFDANDHKRYINKIVARFRNPYLTDEVVRVGRSPIRKLSPNDRLVKPALEAYNRGFSIDHLTAAIAAGLLFDFPGDPEAVELQQTIQEKGLSQAITYYTQIEPGHPVHQLVLDQVRQLQSKSQ
ncbi:MAG: mannitol-phosphate 5-dehydrogenase [Bacilli bacterium]|nr:mannitol-phosphate 5-dehydrogenase [Bacilli bacterium]